ncbi:hypothetical protein AgCh_025906 [Apium graveolens]
MTGDKALLSQFEDMDGPLVTFGDNNKGFTMGYGKLISGKVLIADIGVVAGLEVNLLSVSQFTDRGFNVSFGKGDCSIISKKIEQSKLWHKKLSHLNYKAINTLVKKELVSDMPNLEFVQNEVCEACHKGKMKKSSHKSKNVNSINAPLQLIHMNLFRPDNVLSISRKKYALVMVDDYSRYLINKSLGKSPYSILSKRKPTVKHLHLFGSKCYILKDNSEYVEKFDSKLFEAIFLGYSLERTAYKVYVPEQKKIMESTYVTFDDGKCRNLECLDDNETEALKFENLNIDSDSDDEAEVNTSNRMDEESTEQVNHENRSSSQTLEFDSTNSGEKEEKVLQVMPMVKKIQKIQVNKLTPRNRI